MDLSDHVMPVITFTVCKIIQKSTTKIDFWYQIDFLRSSPHVCLVPIIHFNYYFLNNLAYYNCSYQLHSWFMALITNIFLSLHIYFREISVDHVPWKQHWYRAIHIPRGLGGGGGCKIPCLSTRGAGRVRL